MNAGIKKVALFVVIGLSFAFPAQAATLEAEQLAQLLAGLPSTSELAFSAAYNKKVDAAWKRYESAVGSPLAKWSAQEIGRLKDAQVFYPFSGPDFLTINRVYPDATHYVLVALQKAGKPLAIDRLNAQARQKLEKKMGDSWQKFGTLGFFRTHDLDDDQRDSLSLGTTSILLAFSARLGYRVLSAQPLSFSENEMKWLAADGESAKWDSVRIALSKAGKTITLDYISLDLSDKKLQQSEPVQKWIDASARSPVFLKAASHLLQKPSFSILRQSLLNYSPVLVQDETGLDYTDLKKIGRTRLYGNFVKAHVLFSSTRQQALTEAYKTADPAPPPLPFAFSYQKKAGFRSMQVANRY